MWIRQLALCLVIAAGAAALQGSATHHVSGDAARVPLEAGQGAFAAIQELVALLEADPATDWSRVDLEALRRHLADMDNVVIGSAVVTERDGSSMRYTVTGHGAVGESIRRMVPAHAAAVNGVDGWAFTAMLVPDGAVMTVTPDEAGDLAKIGGLGFIGLLARGRHHQQHHLMIATGRAPHGKGK